MGMTDREKVIKGLEICSTGHCEISCPYNDVPQCTRAILSDALALLKEQDAVEPFHRCIGKEYTLIANSHFDYCPYCGNPIAWEGR